jgi:hypothetical protein
MARTGRQGVCSCICAIFGDMNAARWALLDRLLDRILEGVARHADAIAEIASRGEISVFVVEPSDSWKEALSTHGWNGELVFAMSERARMAMSCADDVTERWVARRSEVARIFAVIEDESLLVNSDAGLLGIEPGSIDEGGPFRS